MFFQKNSGSDGVRLASVTMPIVSPAPVAPCAYSGSRWYCFAKSSGVRLPVCTAAGFTPERSRGVWIASLPKVG